MHYTDVLLIAHRGESYDAPENTLAAINLAWERNADAVEIDIRISKDDQIVVIHDDSTVRFGGNTKKIQEQTLQELKSFDVGIHKGDTWAHETIPTLEEVLDTIPAGKLLFVEIKCGIEVLRPLKKILFKRPLLHEKVVFIGLELETMQIIKQEFPRHEVCWVYEMEIAEEKNTWVPRLNELITKAQKAGLDGLDVLACETVNDLFVQKIHSAGMKLYVWTVNDAEEAKRLCEAGVDGITTDRAMWLKDILRSFP
jgi:glycerophosphoryl diester phosphodiesterase